MKRQKMNARTTSRDAEKSLEILGLLPGQWQLDMAQESSDIASAALVESHLLARLLCSWFGIVIVTLGSLNRISYVIETMWKEPYASLVRD